MRDLNFIEGNERAGEGEIGRENLQSSVLNPFASAVFDCFRNSLRTLKKKNPIPSPRHPPRPRRLSARKSRSHLNNQ